ncbi:MAG TPA: prepilin peptidase [Thermoanaerobaculia bacterium]|nr:prepilin peptidase [Thermoanaerobaculia bacterium]
MPLFLLYWIYAGIVGLLVGSYLNVVIYRLPRRLSTVLPRSRCPACGTQIRPYDNIPVFAFLWLRGRCRTCGVRIGWRYPAIEALTGALFVASAIKFGLSLDALVAAAFCAAMVVLASIDAEHYLLPDRITLPGIAIGLAVQPWLRGPGLLSAAIGAAAGAGVLTFVWGVWYLIRREHGMGFGDVKMLAMIGAFLGLRSMGVALFVAVLAGALCGLALLAVGRFGFRSKLPFGLFLAFGALVGLFFGDALSTAYLGLL